MALKMSCEHSPNDIGTTVSSLKGPKGSTNKVCGWKPSADSPRVHKATLTGQQK